MIPKMLLDSAKTNVQLKLMSGYFDPLPTNNTKARNADGGFYDKVEAYTMKHYNCKLGRGTVNKLLKEVLHLRGIK